MTHHEDDMSMVAAEAGKLNRSLILENQSGNDMEIFWINHSTDEAHLIVSVLSAKKKAPIETFVGHTFEIRAIPDAETGTCTSQDNTCAVRRFTVGEDSHPVVTVNEDMEIDIQNVVAYEVTKQTSKGVKEEAPENSQMHVCQEKAKDAIRSSPLEAEKALDELVNCAMWNVTKTLAEKSEEVSFHAHRRMMVASSLENFTCADQELPTSTPLEIRPWVQPSSSKNKNTKNDVVERDVHVLLDRQASKVHLIKNFVSEEECEAMERAAKPILHRATVADGKGGSQFSPSRKAMQAGIKVRWNKEADGEHIATLSRRVYDYVNHVLGLNITEHGQEDLMSIQYFGREDDEEPDRYMPHCDGECHGEPHKYGTRMATTVMYCKVPLKGGATNFRNSGLHIVPEMGSATFFSYIDPDTRIMDRQFTEHSGCPVLVGEKKIVTQWIRLGVDNENPWDSFNTLGVKKSEEDDD
eukprot:CAMPEP_0198302732 /NCGR_PEP_ID=MMETSP1449-20131203/56265_1 /TAXON_ID=420275 /ORGANISM="Attheya septentrionalis, Strain CCMP2084" /LENGTH=467 /DNA_ID=CAMNT_0044005177 /DNA_START=311 /DNA_END=1714 /DNA_ORIENTATION=-